MGTRADRRGPLRNRVTLAELAWDLERSTMRALFLSDVDVTVSVRCARALESIRRGERVAVAPDAPVRIEFALEADDG
jgi:hypothetical protein